jgi:hypothetical protein
MRPGVATDTGTTIMAIIRPAHRQVEDIETGSRDTKNRQECKSVSQVRTQVRKSVSGLSFGQSRYIFDFSQDMSFL